MQASDCLTRRRFLAVTAAAAAGATWFDVPRLLAAESADKNKYGGFPMGIQSYSLRGFGIDGALDIIHKLNLHYVEFFRMHYPPTADPAKVAEMNAKLQARDLAISAHGVEQFTSDHEANRRFFLFAKQAGIRNISADPAPNSFDSLDRLVAEFDIRIAIHNHGPGHRYDRAEQVYLAVQKHDKRIGYCADLGHYIRSGEDPVQVINLLGERLYGVHLKDFAEKKKDAKGVILGQGQLDTAGVFQALRKVKFPADGALSLEYEENEKDPVKDIQVCLEIAARAASGSGGRQ